MYFRVIHPVIVTEGKEAGYAPLTSVFRVLSVDYGMALSGNATCPAPLPCSSTVAWEADEMIKRLFPALHADSSNAQKSDIASRLGKLTAT